MPGSNDVDQIIWPDRATILHDSRCDGVAEAVETILDGSDATLITKNINANGTYLASSDNADGFSQVAVTVPNTYAAGDEGKVVQSGALVSQTSTSTTTNGTIDTTTNNSIVVNVANSYSAGDEGKVVSGGTLVAQGSDEVTQNGTVDTTLINSLTVNVSSGGGGASSKAVNFYDYDGTIVHSYTAAEFAQLTEFPSNPSHDGLTAQGWMWSTFAKAKRYVSKYGALNIGQKYRVTDGKTRIFIELDEYRKEPVLGLGVNGSVDIDWGDGSTHTTLTGTNVSTYVSTQPHTYPSGGAYVITLTVTGTANFLAKNSVCGLLMKDGFDINESRHYRNAIKRLFIGDSVTLIQSSAFAYCHSLGSVTIPDSVTLIQSQAFYYCYSLGSVTIPDSVTLIQSKAFYYCYSLGSVIIPDSVTLIQSQAFINCSSLKSITIPNSVTTIQSAAFQYCYSLGSAIIPDSVTTIQSSAFAYCSSLESITISNSVTTIESNVFTNCYSLGNVAIPDGVTKIQSQAFSSCSSFGIVKFKRATPPTVQNVNAFSGIPTDCAILVQSYAYLSASNYPSPSTYTYAYYDTFADGATLPATIPDESTTSLTWYATIADLRAETNPITVGNGKEVYAKMTSTA